MKTNLFKQEAVVNKNRATFKNLIDLDKQKVPQSKSRSKSRTNISKSKSVTKRNKKKESQVSISIQPSLSNVSSRKELSQPERPAHNRTQQQQNKEAMKMIINMKNKVTALQQKLEYNQKTLNEINNWEKNEQSGQVSRVNDKFKDRADKLLNFIQQYRQQILKQTQQIGDTYLKKLEDQNYAKQLKQIPQIAFEQIVRVRDLRKPDLSMYTLQEKLNRLEKQFSI